jgi:molybdate transport system substrate-binding protein
MQSLIVPALDTRAALRLVEMGEADAGIVYSTDAKSSSKVEVVGTFSTSLHDPIRYPIAICRGGKSPKDAQEFVAFLRATDVKDVFTHAGFVVLAPETTGKP